MSFHGQCHICFHVYMCRNPNLGLTTKAKAREGAGQKWSPGVTLHAPGRLRVWESGKIEFPHPQVNSHFGSWSPDGLLNLQRVIARAKTHQIEEFLISLEGSWNLNV
jgi:predicted RNA-binding protein with PUA domain